MSVEVTRLPSGLTVVTDSMPHLQTASLGVWVGSGSRDEEPNEHGISHLLEHMAFKGTKRRTARQIAEEIEAVGGDLNAATSSETTAYFASVLKADMPLAVDVLSDILANPTFDPAELKREQNVIVQEIGASEDTPDDLVFDYLQSTAFPNQPIGRPILGTPRNRVLVQGPEPAGLSGAQLSRARHGGGGDRRGRARRRGRRGRAALRPVQRPGRAGAAAGELRRRHQARGARSRAGPYRARARRAAAARRRLLQPAGLHHRARRRHVVAAVPGGAREARPLLHDLGVPRALFRHRHVRHLCRHRRRRREGTDAGRGRRDRGAPPATSPRPRSTAPRRRSRSAC